MRTWGRVWDELGNPTWVEVTTDPSGFNDYVYITALIQSIKLNLAESPFWANFGLPAHQSIIQQAAPDFNMQFIATYFSQFFASLIISRTPIASPPGTSRAQQQNSPQTQPLDPTPTYYIQVLRHDGSLFEATIGI
jgi:hypothetical protein